MRTTGAASPASAPFPFSNTSSARAIASSRMTTSSSSLCRTSSARRSSIRPICASSIPERASPSIYGTPARATQLRRLYHQLQLLNPSQMQGSPVGTVPAQSAVEAAPAMLAQLRSDMASTGGPNSTAQTAATAPNPASQAASQAVVPTPAPQPPVLQPATQPAAQSPPPAVPATVSAQPPATTPLAGNTRLHLAAQLLRSIRRPTPPASGATFQVPSC